ncbi:hypothetical protein ACL58G_03430 [Massilia sp. GER05]|uniref:hypothetical protein n=1 Tax=Massilia sp. GER05 TaxID=3394605 RepID=UPI003F83CD43
MTEPTPKAFPTKSESVSKEYQILKDIVRSPESVDENLRQTLLPALSNQGSLAAFEYPKSGIIGMSLNTHKAIANGIIEGGYEALNSYRKAALEKLGELANRKDQPSRGTIDWYKRELAMKNEQLKRVTDDITLMSQRLDEVMAFAQRMAKAAGKENEFQKRRAELLRKFKEPKVGPEID